MDLSSPVIILVLVATVFLAFILVPVFWSKRAGSQRKVTPRSINRDFYGDKDLEQGEKENKTVEPKTFAFFLDRELKGIKPITRKGKKGRHKQQASGKKRAISASAQQERRVFSATQRAKAAYDAQFSY